MTNIPRKLIATTLTNCYVECISLTNVVILESCPILDNASIATDVHSRSEGYGLLPYITAVITQPYLHCFNHLKIWIYVLNHKLLGAGARLVADLDTNVEWVITVLHLCVPLLIVEWIYIHDQLSFT